MKMWIYRSSLDVAKPLRGYLFYYAKERFAIGSEKRLLSRDL